MRSFIKSLLLVLLLASQALGADLWQGSLWAGSLWKSSQGYANRYHLYLDPARGLRDLVSRDALTTTIPAARTLDGVTFAANTPAIIDGRLRGVPVVQNKFTSPSSPATQSVTLAAGIWTMYCTGDGSVVYSGNTATPGTPVTFTLASSTTANATVTGTLTFVQINSGAYVLPVNAGSATVTEAGTSTLALTDGMSEGLGEAASGTLVTEWVPKFAAANVSADCAILTSGNLSLRYDGPNTMFELSDGTNTATVAYTAVNGTAVWIHGDYDWATNTLRVGYSTTETGTITWGTATYFASTFVPSTFQPLTGSEYQMLGKTYISKGDTAIFNRGTNDIGIPGGIGFGVGTYPGTLPTGYSELTGTTTLGHDNYGNYQFRDGSIVCWIPAHYVKIGTGSNGPYVNKISVVKYSAFASEAAANSVGYFLPRSFKDGGVNKLGYFVDKYQCSKNALGTGYVASSIPLGNPISMAADHNPIGDLTATAGANYYYSAITAAKARDGENGAVSATPKWFAVSRFIYADLAMLSVAHGQAARSATYCAWYDATGAKNYPKGNNNASNDIDDTSVTFTHDGYASGTCAKTGSGSPFAKTTHNGQNCGVTDLNGNMWEVSMGMTCIATTKTITAVTNANPCQITAASHGRVTGDYVQITSVGGTTQLNDKMYLITKVDDNNFTLQGVDSSAFGTFTTGGTATFGDWYAAKESVAMKDFTSGSTGVTDHWGATGVAAMMDEFVPALETAYPNNGFAQRYGSGANQVLSEAVGSVLTALGLPKDATGIDTTGTNLFGKDYFYQYVRNELCAVSGGGWGNGQGAGVWFLYWAYGRTTSSSFVGFRCASYGD